MRADFFFVLAAIAGCDTLESAAAV